MWIIKWLIKKLLSYFLELLNYTDSESFACQNGTQDVTNIFNAKSKQYLPDHH